MSCQIDQHEAAKRLTGGDPLAYDLKKDGTLVVIAHDGKKFRFSSDQVKAILAPKTASKTAGKQASNSRKASPPRAKAARSQSQAADRQ